MEFISTRAELRSHYGAMHDLAARKALPSGSQRSFSPFRPSLRWPKAIRINFVQHELPIPNPEFQIP